MKSRSAPVCLCNKGSKKISSPTLQAFFQSCFPAVSAKTLFFITMLLQLLSANIQAQTGHSRKKEDFDVHEFFTNTITIDSPAEYLLLNHIQGITVMDARADTTHIGLMQKKVVDPLLGALNGAAKNQVEQRINKKPTFVVLNQGLQAGIAQFLGQSIVFGKDTALPKVLMVIKKLWLSDELALDDRDYNKSRIAGPANKDAWTSGIDTRIEFYLHAGSDYYPLYRYDSIISEAMTVSEYGARFIELALRLSLQKMKQMDARIAGIASRKKFSLEDINTHNQDCFNLPALKDTALRQGVYMSFEEFKNNRPSQEHFELKKDKITDIIYIKQADGKEWVARNVWGYCNGENAYIRSGDNFFLLQRLEKAFYIFGAKNLTREESRMGNTGSYYSANSGLSAPVYSTTYKTVIQLEPFQLDWTTGKLY